MQKILVVAPHPDDDVIGCGGSIAKHVKNGNQVSIVYMTSGDLGSLTHSGETLAAIREDEARQAAQSLGVTEVQFFRNPDGDVRYTKESFGRMAAFIRTLQPDIVYVPHKYDGHHDHQATHEITINACGVAGSPVAKDFGSSLWSVSAILCYEVWTPLQEVHYVEDISEEMEDKLKALQMHQSQIKSLAYDEGVKNLNRLRGLFTGQGTYCECFQILKISKLFW